MIHFNYSLFVGTYDPNLIEKLIGYNPAISERGITLKSLREHWMASVRPMGTATQEARAFIAVGLS